MYEYEWKLFLFYYCKYSEFKGTLPIFFHRGNKLHSFGRWKNKTVRGKKKYLTSVKEPPVEALLFKFHYIWWEYYNLLRTFRNSKFRTFVTCLSLVLTWISAQSYETRLNLCFCIYVVKSIYTRVLALTCYSVVRSEVECHCVLHYHKQWRVRLECWSWSW